MGMLGGEHVLQVSLTLVSCFLIDVDFGGRDREMIQFLSSSIFPVTFS